MQGPLWRVTDARKADFFLQAARSAFANRDTISSTFLSLDNPVSLTRASLEVVAQQRTKYYVSHKADGVRYVLVLDMFDDEPTACMVNRAGEVYATPVRTLLSRFTKRCVFDGELCALTSGEVYLVFNALLVNGKSLFNSSYAERLEQCRACFPISADDPPSTKIQSTLAMRFIVKPTVLASEFAQLPQPQFAVDGLVFTPAFDTVRTGRNPRLLKWKHWNSVDVGFEATANSSSLPNLSLWWDDEATGVRSYINNADFFMAKNSVERLMQGFALAHQLCPTLLFTGIMECGLEVNAKKPHILHFAHVRHDKRTANTPLTIAKTIETIQDNVTYDLICAKLKGCDDAQL